VSLSQALEYVPLFLQYTSAIAAFAGITAAFFAILNYRKIRTPILKSSFTTSQLQARSGVPFEIKIHVENSTNNPIKDLKLIARVSLDTKQVILLENPIKQLETFQNGLTVTLNYLDQLIKVGFIEKNTEERVNKNSDFDLQVSVQFSYK
jgi:hypothetical protein